MQTGVGLSHGGDTPNRMRARMGLAWAGNGFPTGILISRAVAVVAPFPSFWQSIGGELLQSGIGQQIGAFLEKLDLMNLGQDAGGLIQPFVGAMHRIARQGGDQGLDFFGGGELCQFNQSGEPGDQIGVGHHAGAEKQTDRIGIGTESPHCVAA